MCFWTGWCCDGRCEDDIRLLTLSLVCLSCVHCDYVVAQLERRNAGVSTKTHNTAFGTAISLQNICLSRV
jgi:hypothetical protein